MRQSVTASVALVVFSLAAAGAAAQDGRTAARPFQESSAGRAMQRITFGAIDCVDPPLCTTDAFTTSELFVNGTYRDTRLNYGGPLTQADVSNSLLRLIVTQSQTFPNTSTASGFSFTFRGTTVPTLSSELYGPLFGERATTNSRGQLSATFNVHTLRFRSLEGSNIRNGQAGLLWGDTNYDGAQGGYVGICRMDINTTVAFAAVNYGILDQLDLSVAVPVVRTSVEGSNEFIDFAIEGNSITPFTFDPQGRYYVKGASTGLGDIAVGAKYALGGAAEGRAAFTVRTSLPTGSLDDMTGTGELQTHVGFIGSFEHEGFSPHVNVGYLLARGEIVDELNYNVGVSYLAVRDRLTLGGEIAGRRLFDVPSFSTGRQLGSIVSPLTGESFSIHEFTAVERGINLLFVSFGGKVRLTGKWLGSVYAVLPAGSSGLQVTRPTFNFGINYSL